MVKYSKEFKEQALLLSDERGVKKAAGNQLLHDYRAIKYTEEVPTLAQAIKGKYRHTHWLEKTLQGNQRRKTKVRCPVNKKNHSRKTRPARQQRTGQRVLNCTNSTI